MYPFGKEFFNYLESLSSYEVASIVLGVGHWEKSRLDIQNNPNKKPWRYEIGDIILVNLGSVNYGYEASYKHPCIIYANGYNWVLVIPCSTGRYNVKNDHILKGEKSDGFLEKTGIQLDKIRVIDKWRIHGRKLGQVSNPKLNEITNKMIELYFSPVKKRINKLEAEKRILIDEKTALEDRIKVLEYDLLTKNANNVIL